MRRGVHHKTPVAQFVFAAFVDGGQHVAGRGHKEADVAGRGGVRAERVVAGFGGGLGLLVEQVGLLVVGVSGGHLRSKAGNAVYAVERAGRSERDVFGVNRLRKSNQVARIARNIYSHASMILIVSLVLVPSSPGLRLGLCGAETPFAAITLHLGEWCLCVFCQKPAFYWQIEGFWRSQAEVAGSRPEHLNPNLQSVSPKVEPVDANVQPVKPNVEVMEVDFQRVRPEVEPVNPNLQSVDAIVRPANPKI